MSQGQIELPRRPRLALNAGSVRIVRNERYGILAATGRPAGSLGGASAVDGQRRTGDESGFVAEQEGHERRDLVRL